MLKWNQFESKDRIKKDWKLLKNRKIKSKNDIERKRQEIRGKMNNFVNGASSYEGIAINESLNHEIKITPEWILSKFSWTQNAGDGNIFLSSDIYNSHWVELALGTLGISYLKVEDIDYSGKVFITFKLIFEGFKEYPSWYKEMRELNPDKFIDGDR